jgi:hypothetical protein
MGALLQHHSLQSTKYLSKWIEEKGKWFCVSGFKFQVSILMIVH